MTLGWSWRKTKTAFQTGYNLEHSTPRAGERKILCTVMESQEFLGARDSYIKRVLKSCKVFSWRWRLNRLEAYWPWNPTLGRNRKYHLVPYPPLGVIKIEIWRGVVNDKIERRCQPSSQCYYSCALLTCLYQIGHFYFLTCAWLFDSSGWHNHDCSE